MLPPTYIRLLCSMYIYKLFGSIYTVSNRQQHQQARQNDVFERHFLLSFHWSPTSKSTLIETFVSDTMFRPFSVLFAVLTSQQVAAQSCSCSGDGPEFFVTYSRSITKQLQNEEFEEVFEGPMYCTNYIITDGSSDNSCGAQNSLKYIIIPTSSDCLNSAIWRFVCESTQKYYHFVIYKVYAM